MFCYLCKINNDIYNFYSPSYYYECFECHYEKNEKESIEFLKYKKFALSFPCKCGNINTIRIKKIINLCINCAKNFSLEFDIKLLYNTTEYILLLKTNYKLQNLLNLLKDYYINNIFIDNHEINCTEHLKTNIIDLKILPDCNIIIY